MIIAGDYIESYVRQNPFNFRNNISAGGDSQPFTLAKDSKKMCREVIKRGKFPYAHIDLIVMDSGEYYFSEIALNGGTVSARIKRKELDQKKQEVIEGLIQEG